jgi:hypothetical protein
VSWLGLRNRWPAKALVLALAAALAFMGLRSRLMRVRLSRASFASRDWHGRLLLCGLAVLSTLTAIDVRQALLGDIGLPRCSRCWHAAVGAASRRVAA